MSERIYVKPGFQLDTSGKPTTKLLHLVDPKSGMGVPDYGAPVNLDTYWVRRIQCGDAIQIDQKSFESGRDASKKKAADAKPQSQPAPVAGEKGSK